MLIIVLKLVLHEHFLQLNSVVMLSVYCEDEERNTKNVKLVDTNQKQSKILLLLLITINNDNKMNAE
jgi:hypothetical protein